MQQAGQRDAAQAHLTRSRTDGRTSEGLAAKERGDLGMWNSGKIFAGLVVAAGLCAMCWAEDSPNMARQQTITGCLSKGADAGEFVLTDEATSAKIVVKGSADLDKHAANHKVKLTGTQAMEESRLVFKVTNVEHVSDACTPAR